jgi:hypothetical protein
MQALQQQGFRCAVVFADRLEGASGECMAALQRLELQLVVAMRANHGVRMPPGPRLRSTPWSTFARVCANGSPETRSMRAMIFGQRRALRYSHITSDVDEHLPESPWLLMTNLPGTIKKTVGQTYGVRTWIAYGLKQSKNALGWADVRFTADKDSEKWWEIVCRASLRVSVQSPVFQESKSFTPLLAPAHAKQEEDEPQREQVPLSQHTWWDQGPGWKNLRHNLRLIIQPTVFSCLLSPWLGVFALPSLQQGFQSLIAIMNNFQGFVPG